MTTPSEADPADAQEQRQDLAVGDDERPPTLEASGGDLSEQRRDLSADPGTATGDDS